MRASRTLTSSVFKGIAALFGLAMFGFEGTPAAHSQETATEMPGLDKLRASIAPPVLEPGTEDGARDLRSALVPYLTSMAFDSGVVSVEPVDDGYRITVHLQTLAGQMSQEEAVSIEISDYSVLVSEQPDGQWYAASSGPLSMAVTMAEVKVGDEIVFPEGQSVAYSIASSAFEGYYDPKIANYTNAYFVIGESRQVQKTPELDLEATTEPLTIVMKGRPRPDGAADIELLQIGGATRQEMRIPLDPDDPAQTLPLVFKTGPVEAVSIGRGVASLGTLRLYEVGIALLQDSEREGMLEDIRTALRDALPLWTSLDTQAKIAGLEVELAGFGFGKIAALDVDLYLDGIETSGDYTLVYDFTGISAASPFIPAWAHALVPTRFRFGLTASDVNFAEPANLLISNLRLDPDNPLSQETLEKIADTFKNSDARYGIANSTISGQDYAIDYSADFDGKDISLKVEAKGVDTIIDRLQAARQEFPDAMQAISMLQFAKGFGKPMDDGRIQWDIDVGDDGSVTVNGAMIKGPDPVVDDEPSIDRNKTPPSDQPSNQL